MDIFEKKQAKLNAQIANSKKIAEHKQNVIKALKTAYNAVAAVNGDKTINAYKKQLLNSFVTSYKYLVGVKDITTEGAIQALTAVDPVNSVEGD